VQFWCGQFDETGAFVFSQHLFMLLFMKCVLLYRGPLASLYMYCSELVWLLYISFLVLISLEWYEVIHISYLKSLYCVREISPSILLCAAVWQEFS